MSNRTLINPDIQFIKEIKEYGGDTFKDCFQCATCSVVCSLTPQNKAFPRKEMIAAGWGQKEKLLSDPDIWMCYNCGDCNTYCPRGAKPADVISAIRSYVIRKFAFPPFMGSLLKSPKYLIPLLLFPLIVLFLFLYTHLGGNFSQLSGGNIIFDHFLPDEILDIFFVAGNVFIFTFAGIGLFRYWQNLNSIIPAGKEESFISVFVKTISEILFHKSFKGCTTNQNRYWGHLLIFYGFVGALATTGLAFIREDFFGLPAPIPLLNPIKILGNISGLAILVGCVIIFINRVHSNEKSGSSTYDDWLLVLTIFGVALTGLLAEIMRLTATPFIAYNTYYVHLVLVFFLLWYAPYSKLAHMFYRTMALVYLKMNGREKKETSFNAA